MFALIVDTSVHSRAMCYKCYNELISLTTRLAFNEFQASYYSHHMSQSALGEINWLLRVSRCNLTLNPYHAIHMGHYHGHPLTRAMEFRPDHWSTNLRPHLEISRIYALTIDQTYSFNLEKSIMHICIYTIPIFISNPFRILAQSIPIHVSYSIREYTIPTHLIIMPL